MLARDLAKKYNISEEIILTTLKGLKLRAKGDDHELNPAVLMVLKGELEEKGIIPKEPEPVKKAPPVRKPAVKKPAVADEEKPARKKKEIALTSSDEIKEAEKPSVTSVEKPSKPQAAKAVAKAPKIEPVKTQEKIAVKPEPAIEPKVMLPNELAQFQPSLDPNADAAKKTTTTVVKKVIKVIKKVVPKEQPEFVSMKPLAHGKRRSQEPGERHDHRTDSGHTVDKPLEAQPVQPLKRDGPLEDLELKIPITVGDLAFKLQQKANVLLKTLMGMGIFANINQNLGEEITRKLCQEFGFNLKELKTQEEQLILDHEKEQDDPALLTQRAPVVTFMGHVDHGKTSLLDCIRKTKVVDSEHGGITQHIRAYSVKIPKGTITFMDTPGHAAFTAMRARGAHITDIVVLVIAANEGIMPQTLEAINHARAAKVPIVVAMNKMDLKGADPEKVKKQLMENELVPEDWGGKTVVVPVSAQTGQGIDDLLDMILLESEMLELKVNPSKKAAGIVVEAHLSPGKGALATLIVQSGTLKEGDIVIVGPYSGRIKAMFDDRKRPVKEAGPSMPVEILGLPAVPEAGDRFFVAENEKAAREITAIREEKYKAERLRSSSKITLEELLAQKKAGEVRELNVVIKGDVQGSVEALRDSLAKVPAENREVNVKFIHIGVGAVNASDIILASVSKAIVVAFNIGMNADAQDELQKTPVEVRNYNIIYDVVNDVRAALEGMLKPDMKRLFIARAEVRQVFNLSKSGLVAGCFIQKGKMRQKLDVEVIRNAAVIHTGKISALKRFKDDVREVGEGFECGISVSGFDGYQVGDLIEAFQIEHIARKL
ncbi:MAG: translation initiation factor IF-2 [Candidatus Omnitrophica bacterium]|nr:translation initiation factor IF-2 [Candidatus Omnitrophota bacterium]